MALTKISGSVIKDSVSLSGNVSVGGTLTYQDVTNVDALGVGTFRSGINVSGGQLDVGSNIKIGSAGIITASNFKTGVTNLHGTGLTLTGGQLDVGSNIKIGNAGVITATTFSGSGANLTNLNASNIASGTVPTARLGSGTANSSTFLRGDSTFQTVNTDLVSDTSPQLGGGLASNGFNINFADSSGTNNMAKFGASGDLQIYHDSVHSRIVDLGTGDLKLQTSKLTVGNAGNSETMAVFTENGASELYWDNSKKIETTSTGITISGNANFANNNKAIFGTGNDAAIYHNDTDFVINAQDSGATRNMYLYAGTVNEGGIYLFSSGGDTMFKALTDANCFLYYDNSLKLRTMTNGIENRGHNFAVTNNTYDLGTTGLKWRKVYASNTPIVLASINLASNNQHSTFGVQTVYHYGSGTFQVVFSANMPNTNYVVTGSCVGSVNGDGMVVAGIADHTNYRTVGSIRARVSYAPNNNDSEVTNVNLAFFANN